MLHLRESRAPLHPAPWPRGAASGLRPQSAWAPHAVALRTARQAAPHGPRPLSARRGHNFRHVRAVASGGARAFLGVPRGCVRFCELSSRGGAGGRDAVWGTGGGLGWGAACGVPERGPGTRGIENTGLPGADAEPVTNMAGFPRRGRGVHWN